MAGPAAEDRQLQQRAMRRLAVALGLIALAIGGLAVLDRYNRPRTAPQTKAPSTEPPAIAALPPPKPIAPPPGSGSDVAPPAPPPPPSVDSEQSLPPAAPSPGASAAAQQPGTVAHEPRAVERPAANAKAPAATPIANASPPKDAADLRPASGYVVQLGMFSTVENAQGMLERLKAQGVPAYLETRVVVGPFRDRAEADAAQRRLQAGGVSGVIAQRK